MVHRVRTHHWRNGRLEVKDQFFENLELALAFANSVEQASSVKVFSDHGELTHTIVSNDTVTTPTSNESYA